MGRGRPRSVSDERLLIELLLYPDRAVFTSELADVLDVTNETVRTRMADLDDRGLVVTQDLDSGNLYRLSEDGMDHLRTLLRDEYE